MILAFFVLFCSMHTYILMKQKGDSIHHFSHFVISWEILHFLLTMWSFHCWTGEGVPLLIISMALYRPSVTRHGLSSVLTLSDSTPSLTIRVVMLEYRSGLSSIFSTTTPLCTHTAFIYPLYNRICWRCSIYNNELCLKLQLLYVIQHHLLCKRLGTLTRWIGIIPGIYLSTKDLHKLFICGLINLSTT